MSRTLLVLSVSLVLGACASPRPDQAREQQLAQPAVEASSDSSEECSVYVYRNKTSFHSLNPERPFLYVGDEKIGTLAVGQSYCLPLAPGKHTISVKEAILFMPAYTSGSIEVETNGSTPVYVRYAKDFAGVAVVGANATATGKSRMQVVSEDLWRTRQ